jgi:dipeptidyl aminopeptidase/acylaminoacyl peptidase
MATVRPYGEWASPITPALIAAESRLLAEVALDGEAVYWLEGRPQEGGRMAIVRHLAGATTELTSPPWNARARVHEYGGGALVAAGGRVWFTNFADQQIYELESAGGIRTLSQAPGTRFADGILDRRHDRLIAVAERHRDQEAAEPQNFLASVPLTGGSPTVLESGADFYSTPRLAPGSTHLAWVSWNHPDMPWDATSLWVAAVTPGGSLESAALVAGGPDESIVQPSWSPDGALYFLSDRTGWWNIYQWRDGRVRPVVTMEAEFGRPPWTFKSPTYGFLDGRRIAATCSRKGGWELAIIDTDSGGLRILPTPYTEISHVHASGRSVVFIGGSPVEPPSVVRLAPDTGRLDVLARASAPVVEPRYLSVPEPTEFDTEGGRTAHALFYPPTNPDFTAPLDARPPLIVMCHGGPTSAASTALDLRLQFWTSRGFAVLDVNYGGSSGYGRPYRERLHGAWGVVDVMDCLNGARALVAAGRVDRERLAIRGGSAGGYTTLCALTFHNLFKAGASYYGVSDLEVLARDTHKFESRYLDRLVGPYPDRRELYRARSPLNSAALLSSPVLFLQGLDDKVVPPNQAELMVAAMKARGVPVAHVVFEGEGHGFRRADTIQRALEAELYFYSRVLGFTPADSLPGVEIANLDE